MLRRKKKKKKWFYASKFDRWTETPKLTAKLLISLGEADTSHRASEQFCQHSIQKHLLLCVIARRQKANSELNQWRIQKFRTQWHHGSERSWWVFWFFWWPRDIINAKYSDIHAWPLSIYNAGSSQSLRCVLFRQVNADEHSGWIQVSVRDIILTLSSWQLSIVGQTQQQQQDNS